MWGGGYVTGEHTTFVFKLPGENDWGGYIYSTGVHRWYTKMLVHTDLVAPKYRYNIGIILIIVFDDASL